MKCCSKCTRWKVAADFYVDRRPGRSRDGRHHACIACEREAAAERARRRYVPKATPRVRPASASGQIQRRDMAGKYARAA